MRLLQQALDDRRQALMKAEMKLRQTEEQLYTSPNNVNQQLIHDLRVLAYHCLYTVAQLK